MKKLAMLILIVGMLIGAGGCYNYSENSTNFVYYSDMDCVSDGYFDVQKFLDDGDQELFKEQKPWILLYTVFSTTLFPYEYLAFNSVPYIPTIP